MGSRSNLETLMRPQAVAVVGASERAGSLGSVTIQNMSAARYTGRLYAVNPKYEQVHGIDCYPSLAAIPDPVDCAILCLPAKVLTNVLGEVAESGARSAIVFASGFAETGEEGRTLQDDLRSVAVSHNLALCGPNCLGVINFRDRFLGFSALMTGELTPGRVAAVCQSGSVAIALLNSGRGIDYSYVVSSGNEAVTTIEDYLEFFLEDDSTDVILAFVEGFRNTPKLRQVAARALKIDKPIIVLKVGSSMIGKRTVVAHTGALAGSDAIHQVFFQQTGIVRVADLDEMLETAVLFQKASRPRGSKVGAIAISGGEVGLVADISEQVGLEFAELTPRTLAGLRELLPPFSNVGNPLDAWGKGDLRDTYARCLELIGADEGVDLVAVCQDAQVGLGEGQASYYEDLAHSVVRVEKNLDKPFVLFSNISGGFHPILRKVLNQGNIPTLQGTEESLKAIRHLIDFASLQSKSVCPAEIKVDSKRVKTVRGLLTEGSLSEHNSKEILSLYGIPTTREALAQSLEEAKAAAREIGYPVVLKVDSPDIQHKTEVKVIKLNVGDEQILTKAYEEILANAKRAVPTARVQGVVVQEMLNLASAIEVIAGVTCDAQFGPTLLLGLGGIMVEVLKDVSLRVAPIQESDARSMLDELRGAELLRGFRGTPPADSEAIVDILMKLSTLAVELQSEIAEIDINPLIVFPVGSGAVAADALVVCSG